MHTVISKTFEWKPEYAVHVPEIDAEHQNLFRISNRLHESMLAGHSVDILGKIFAESTQYMTCHMDREEKLMAEIGYPELQAHAQEHHDELLRVKAFVERFERGETAIAIEVLIFMSEWIRMHVMVTDRRLGDYVQVEKNFTAYLERLLQGDLKGCGLIVQRLLAEGISFTDLYVHLFQRAMYRTGELWMKNQISVAAEHLITTITLSMMTLVHPTLFDSPRNGKKVVVTCVGGELHQIGGKMVSDTFEFLGWDSYFLGANTPVEDLLELLGEKQPEVLCLSVSLSSHIGQFKETVEKTHARFPGLDILAGGQAFLNRENESNSGQCLCYLRSLDELESWIANR